MRRSTVVTRESLRASGDELHHDERVLEIAGGDEARHVRAGEPRQAHLLDLGGADSLEQTSSGELGRKKRCAGCAHRCNSTLTQTSAVPTRLYCISAEVSARARSGASV